MCSGGCEERMIQCGCGRHGPRIEAFVVPCILMTLRKRPIHGYELMEELSGMPFLRPVPDPGVVYRHLRRLEDDGMVESSLQPGSGGPARKVYSLTPDGESYWQAWVSSLRGKKETLESFLVAAESDSSPSLRQD